VIFTVFAAPADPSLQWRAQLLEYSWQRAHQPGELVRLTPTPPGSSAPAHSKAVVKQTLAWNPHPYTNDEYAGYDTPSAVMEWLFRDRVEGSVLLLGLNSVLHSAVTEEVSPGKVLAAAWPDMPTGEGPFGLAMNLKFLKCYCVNRELALAPVQLPILIHTSDLRKIAPRWAELTAIIRSEGRDTHGALGCADRIAYALAAAEYRLLHAHSDLRNGTDDETGSAPVTDYSRAVESARGEIVWDEQVYEPWSAVYPEKAKPGRGRDFLALLNEYATRRQSGADLAAKRPLRRSGVRESRVLEDMHLEVPGYTEFVTLNSSAASIWELCDGRRTLAQIVAELGQLFDAPRETLQTAVESTAAELVAAGALEVEDLS